VCRAWPFHFLQSPQVTLTLESESRATSQAAFGIQRLRTLAIAIAPVREQVVLLRRLKRALAGVSELGRVVVGAASCSQALERAALAKAFRGELVEQDPNDEPASAMLERLAAERQAAQETSAAAKRSPRQKVRA
jgi:type I restriction enzyme, S subunit